MRSPQAVRDKALARAVILSKTDIVTLNRIDFVMQSW
jgi:hypothetical protein